MSQSREEDNKAAFRIYAHYEKRLDAFTNFVVPAGVSSLSYASLLRAGFAGKMSRGVTIGAAMLTGLAARVLYGGHEVGNMLKADFLSGEFERVHPDGPAKDQIREMLAQKYAQNYKHNNPNLPHLIVQTNSSESQKPSAPIGTSNDNQYRSYSDLKADAEFNDYNNSRPQIEKISEKSTYLQESVQEPPITKEVLETTAQPKSEPPRYNSYADLYHKSQQQDIIADEMKIYIKSANNSDSNYMKQKTTTNKYGDVVTVE
ncbi:unnamed protein product [Oikopleura dioica]|uniref:Uncharacterized protein n=1 Tax=Oikopleura dioica TaxID=34765 RepID=E4YZF8_OIKDI|nr:unnamed protein product [Oikopleura dioica]